ncbi:zinc-binding oxidoreductase CipB [Aspergillus sclerotioniger CBS 115572]|uniref:Zinc-binding oxidoreductase CipB n=1 Tax=Aspergillus sclerotioniger CBS 115572 TaxID=1450535 RepID=A0A317W4T1_9EURO|nr:zinc-binding oxidoreductase CipB [Aspergillus sclerotioniger CBS 115572]PWY81626.1 zinc-binding oxidoreductase CipB [Aspergillus sclerotioniger CBS 115572]
MSISTSNAAAWLTAAKAHPFEVKEAPLWKPEENEVLVRNHAVAINPVDNSLQTRAWWPMNYPTMLGQDVAGEVIAVGPNVTRFKPGDRVFGHAVGMATKRNQDNAFQAHTILQINMASELPDNIPYENAAVLPLAFSTACCGLFQDEFLKMQLPTEPRASLTGKTLLVWGGASCVGSNAIQLAVAAGYEVITTASPKNFDYVKKLGAIQVFNYSSPTVTEDLIQALQGKTLVGVMDCIGFSATPLCAEVVSKTEGTKFVATVQGRFPAPPEGVSVKQVFGTTIKDNFVGKAVYEDFLPHALRASTFIPAPAPLVVGNGLESIQTAVDRYGQGGISAQKLVVLL